MGLGGSKLQDELNASKRDLTAARVKLQALEAQSGVLQTEAQQTSERLRQREADLAAKEQERERLIRAKDDELSKAIKQRQLAEELRRNDALLAKRVMCAQMKAGGRSPSGVGELDAGSVVAGGAMAAQMVLAADDMVQLRQNMLQLGERLELADARGRGLQRARTQQARRELCDAVWAADLCDVSVALRGADFMALGGLRLPRAPTPGQLDGSGLSPGLAVLRCFGDPAMKGPWVAAGGSLLWDPNKEQRQVASLRVGLIAQAAPGQQLTLGFDEKGFLSGSFKVAMHEALSLRLSGKADLNQKQRPTAGLQFFYDLD